MQLKERFNNDSNGLKSYMRLATILRSDVIDDAVCGQYPAELLKDDLPSQLATFRREYEFFNVLAAQKTIKSMCSDVKLLFHKWSS